MKEVYFDMITEMVKDWAFKDRMDCQCEAARIKNKLEYFNEMLDILRAYYDEEEKRGCPYAE